MPDCTHDCSNCQVDCESRNAPAYESLNPLSNVKRVFAVVSGKGGVGKSLVTSLLAVESERQGYKTAVFDADITGPSIPEAFGVHDKIYGTEEGMMIPASSVKGTKLISLNLLIDNETDPVVWRGPVISGLVKQFWTDVIWGEIDNMFIDMPPGTGDVPLTVFQSIPIDGIIVVTTPQDLVSMIVEKAVNMAKLMDIPILGIVENMSGFVCPDCGSRHDIFGKSRLAELSAKLGVENTAAIPIDPSLAELTDRGVIELHESEALTGFASKLFGE